MKKWLFVGLSIVLVLSLCACTQLRSALRDPVAELPSQAASSSTSTSSVPPEASSSTVSGNHSTSSSAASTTSSSVSESTGSATAWIQPEEAKRIALEHAKLSESAVSRLKIERDVEEGAPSVPQYEIEFVADGAEYEYVIHGVQGIILKAKKNDKSLLTTTVKSTATGQLLSRDEAIAKALAHAGLKQADVRELEAELDWENNDTVRVWEVDFEAGNVEYSYVIDAADGNVLHVEKEMG